MMMNHHYVFPCLLIFCPSFVQILARCY
jgi:hypothetical protein